MIARYGDDWRQHLWWYSCIKLRIHLGLTTAHPRYTRDSNRGWITAFGKSAAPQTWK